MTRKERFNYILDYFNKKMGNVTTELDLGSAFQLLVATLLSSQCTDKRINMVTPKLFKQYPKAKANHISEMSKMLVSDFDGEVPDNTDDLIKLPGVGRKTANVIQAVWFGKPTLAVDTHVYRVSHRLGLVPADANTPYKVEQALLKNIPEDEVANAHHWLLLHGRYTCKSLKPECTKCELNDICPKIMQNSK